MPSPLFTTADKGVLFKFNYTANRELFEVGSVNGGKPVTASNLFSEQLNPPDPTTCNNGDYYHNNANDSTRAMYICTSGKNKTLFTYTDITGIVCRYLCPAPASEFVKESFLRQWSNATQWPNGVLPRAGEDVYINGNWTLFLDIDPAPAGTITIDGSLRVNDNRDVQITAKNIFVRAGDVQFGTPTAAFTHKVTITLTGGKSDVPIVIDPSLSVSKSLVNTGSLSLYGVVPGSVITKLTSSASVGATIINVADANGWNIGDQIVLSPSYSNVGESEVVTITAINNKAITFTPALLYGHFGASGVTITNSAGSVDARTSVGHLTRNIVIKAGSDETWGFTFINYGFRDGSKLRVGQLIVNGVQFIKGSQKGTPMPAMLFMNNIADSTSKIAGSSFMNCFGLCLNIQNSNNVQIQNNVFSNVYQMAVTFSTITNVVFSSNLMTNIWSDNTIITACVGFYEHVTPVTDGVYITNNWCHGSTMHAYVFPYIDCADVDINPFANNTAGSSTVGFIFNKVSGTCIAFSWASAFACNIGQLATAPPTTLFQNFTHFVMIDNARGVTLRFGGGSSNDYTAYLTNSFISAVSRPSCI